MSVKLKLVHKDNGVKNRIRPSGTEGVWITPTLDEDGEFFISYEDLQTVLDRARA